MKCFSSNLFRKRATTSGGFHGTPSDAQEFGWIDVLVNNAAFQNPVDKPEDLTLEQFRRTFGTNIEATFFVTQAALPHMPEGSSIINTASITGLQGHKQLLDYAVHRISAGCHGRE